MPVGKKYIVIEQEKEKKGTIKSFLYVSQRHFGCPQFSGCPLDLLGHGMLVFFTRALCGLYCVQNKKNLPWLRMVKFCTDYYKAHTNRCAGR
jgi:hypothetical protein